MISFNKFNCKTFDSCRIHLVLLITACMTGLFSCIMINKWKKCTFKKVVIQGLCPIIWSLAFCF